MREQVIGLLTNVLKILGEATHTLRGFDLPPVTNEVQQLQLLLNGMKDGSITVEASEPAQEPSDSGGDGDGAEGLSGGDGEPS